MWSDINLSVKTGACAAADRRGILWGARGNSSPELIRCIVQKSGITCTGWRHKSQERVETSMQPGFRAYGATEMRGDTHTLSICTIGMWATRLLLFWNQLKAAFNRAREEYFGRTLNKINAEDDKEILIMLRTCAVVSLGFTQFASSCDLRDIIINIKKSRNVWVWRLMCIWDDCVSDSHYDQTNSLQWNPQRLILFLPGCQSDISHVLSLWVALLFPAENLIFVFPSHPFW